MSEQGFNSAFKSWKIYLAVAIGLLFSIYVLVSAFQEKQFVQVSNKTGTHSWKDSNKNHKIDYKLETEFIPTKNGNFRLKTKAELMSEITWTKKSFFFLFLAIICMFGRDLAYMWRIRILSKNQLTLKASFYVIMLWEFASAISPGVVGGAAVAMFILNKEKIPLGKSTAIVVVTAMMDNLFYIVLIPVLFLFISPSALFPAQSNYEKSIEWIFYLGFGLIFLMCALLFISIFFLPNLIKNFITFIFSLPFLKKWKEKAIQTGNEVVITSKEFRQEKVGFWLKTFIATLISWTSRYLVINCVLAAFITLGFKEHLYILGKQLVLWLFMLISPSPGASGIAEFAFQEILGDFSNSLFLIGALAILWRLISYFPYLIIGSIILPKWLKKSRE